MVGNWVSLLLCDFQSGEHCSKPSTSIVTVKFHSAGTYSARMTLNSHQYFGHRELLGAKGDLSMLATHRAVSSLVT